MNQTKRNFQQLKDIIVALRQPDGCPWDKKQTPESFKSYIIEEAHELMEALEEGDPQQIREELGDMYFQLTFLGQLYEESGDFSVADALKGISEKMIQRHPHVFGEETVESEEEQRRRWNELKSTEKKKVKKASELVSGVPKSMPALRRAQRVSERAAHNGFEWQKTDEIFSKIEEELAELKEAMQHKNKQATKEELGDLLLTIVNLGRFTDTNAEEALISATEKFIIRFETMENLLTKKGRAITESTPQELLSLWQKSKMI